MNSSLTKGWLNDFEASGISVTGIISQEYYPHAFGNGEAVFESGELRFRIERDRGEDQVGIAFDPHTDRYYELNDIKVAFGWADPYEIAAETRVLPLVDQLRKVGNNFAVLITQLTGPEAPFLRARLERIEEKRLQANLESFDQD